MSSDDAYVESPYRRTGVPKSKQTNVLLMRDTVGATRNSTYSLPNSNFTYGKSEGTGAGNGVKECLSTWEDNTVQKNRLKPHYTKAVDPPVAYGKKSDVSTPMSALMTNQYQREAILTSRIQQVDAAHIDPAAAQRAQRKEANAKVNAYAKNGVPHTKASLGHVAKTETKPSLVDTFVMERFKNVPSRVRLVNQSDVPHEQQQQQQCDGEEALPVCN